MAYSPEQIQQAMRRAMAAGDQAAVADLKQRLTEAYQAEVPDPSAGMGTGELAAAGFSRGVRNVGRHAANLVGLLSDEELAGRTEMDAPLMKHGAAKAGNIAGEMVVTAPLMAGGAGLAGRTAMGAKALANPFVRGVAEGAAQGALMAEPGSKTAGAVYGGALGGILPAAGTVAGKVAHGVKRTPEAARLLAEGVDLTPGQMNPGGVLNQMEEAWQSVPGVGAVIKGARDNAQRSFQRRAAEVAAAPGTKIAAGEADDMLEQAYKSFEPLYDQAKGFKIGYPGVYRVAGGDLPLRSFGQKPGLLRRAAYDRGVRADDATRKSVAGWLENQLTRISGKGAGPTTSDALMDLRSKIRAEARKAAAAGDDAAADLLGNGEKAVTDAIESQLPPDALSALRTADSRYGLYKQLEDAVARSKDMPGGFTPAKLSEAVASANRGLGKGAYARGGGGPLRDLASDGTASLNMRSPPTGQRLAAIGIPAAGAAANPALATGVGAGMLGMVGTQTGRRLAAGATRPQQLAQALEEAMRQRIADPYRAALPEYLQRAAVAGFLPR